MMTTNKTRWLEIKQTFSPTCIVSILLLHNRFTRYLYSFWCYCLPPKAWVVRWYFFFVYFLLKRYKNSFIISINVLILFSCYFLLFLSISLSEQRSLKCVRQQEREKYTYRRSNNNRSQSSWMKNKTWKMEGMSRKIKALIQLGKWYKITRKRKYLSSSLHISELMWCARVFLGKRKILEIIILTAGKKRHQRESFSALYVAFFHQALELISVLVSKSQV